jgi:hypothetical protein
MGMLIRSLGLVGIWYSWGVGLGKMVFEVSLILLLQFHHFYPLNRRPVVFFQHPLLSLNRAFKRESRVEVGFDKILETE